MPGEETAAERWTAWHAGQGGGGAGSQGAPRAGVFAWAAKKAGGKLKEKKGKEPTHAALKAGADSASDRARTMSQHANDRDTHRAASQQHAGAALRHANIGDHATAAAHYEKALEHGKKAGG